MRIEGTRGRPRAALFTLALVLPLSSGCSGGDDTSPGTGGLSGVSGGGTASTRGGAPGGNAGGAVGQSGSPSSAGTTATAGSGSGGAATGGMGAAAGGSSGGSGSTSGGSTSGGSTSGGSTAGGSTSGGSTSGGSTSGGSTSGGSTSGGSTSGGSTDAKTILDKFKPTGSKATGYETWMNKEIGTPIVASVAVADGNIKGPILIPPGVTYDGKGQSIKPSIPGCDGSQTESQPPVFILAPGATLKNVTINPPSCDGVHLMGDNTLEDVTWTDVGEDAASARSYFPGGKITIKGGSAKSADDKVFQFNTPVQVTISDFTATNISKMVRQNGGSSFEMSVDLTNVKVTGCGEALVRSDTSNCKVKATNVSADCPVHLVKPK